MDNGCFAYKLDNVEGRVVPGKYQVFVQVKQANLTGTCIFMYMYQSGFIPGPTEIAVYVKRYILNRRNQKGSNFCFIFALHTELRYQAIF